MNHYDYARGSGETPPEWGKCSKCRRRIEVDLVSVGGRLVQLCRACQMKPEPKKKPDIPDPAPWEGAK